MLNQGQFPLVAGGTAIGAIGRYEHDALRLKMQGEPGLIQPAGALLTHAMPLRGIEDMPVSGGLIDEGLHS